MYTSENKLEDYGKGGWGGRGHSTEKSSYCTGNYKLKEL